MKTLFRSLIKVVKILCITAVLLPLGCALFFAALNYMLTPSDVRMNQLKETVDEIYTIRKYIGVTTKRGEYGEAYIYKKEKFSDYLEEGFKYIYNVDNDSTNSSYYFPVEELYFQKSLKGFKTPTSPDWQDWPVIYDNTICILKIMNDSIVEIQQGLKRNENNLRYLYRLNSSDEYDFELIELAEEGD